MFLDPVVRASIYPICSWLFVSGMDEMFVDAWFAYFSTFGRDSWDISLKRLDEEAEKQVAVFIPLWNESAVIEQMMDHNIAAIDYRNYDIFLGVYPNDPRTLEKAVALEDKYPRVHHSICPNDGPTNKADCLNWIYQRMRLEEESRGVRYETIVQHDAEDIIHPKAFKLVNHLIGDYDMVQVPVFPLETPLSYFTHGTYCDEFAEFQVKDIYTRQSIGGFVPSAGVGTAFRREALDEIASLYRNQIYNVNTLTEDYEIGLKFRLHGKRQCLVRKALPYVSRNGHNGNGKKNGNGNGNGNGHNGNGHNGEGTNGKNNAGLTVLGLTGNGYGKEQAQGPGNGNGHSANGKTNGNGYGTNGKTNGNGHNGKTNGNGHNGKTNGNGKRKRVEFIATREYFPNTFRYAVRQKSRWVTGIALQTWEHLGWKGSWQNLYWYWRDRKGLIGNIVSLLSNVIFVYCALMWLSSKVFDTGWTFAEVFPAAGPIWWLLAFTTFFICERMVYKVYAVNKIYGPKQAAGAVIRTPWANVINFSSTMCALYTYFKARVLHIEVKWAKTAHAFPTREQLMEYKRRLGELLLENRLVNALQLEEALQTQKETGERLGEVLIRLGYLTELEFARIFGQQQNIEVREVDPYTIDLNVLRKLSKEDAETYRVIPISFVNGSSLLVASHNLVSAETQKALERATGLRILWILTTQQDFHFALERAYGRLRFDPSGKVRLGEALLNAGFIDEQQLQAALREQKSTHKPLGEILLAKGYVDEQTLKMVFETGGRTFRRVRAAELRPEVLRMIPLELQRELLAVPIDYQAGELTVALGWPLPEEGLRRLIAATGCRVNCVHAPPGDLSQIVAPEGGEAALGKAGTA